MIGLSTNGAGPEQAGTDSARELIYLDPLVEIPVNAVLNHLRKRAQTIVLSGEEGIGKSTLLKVLCNKAPADFDFCLLRAEPDMSLAAVVAVMRARWRSGEGPGTDGVAACLERLIAAGRKPVVVVDDAHELEPYILDALLRIKRGFDRRAQGVIGLVLSARPAVERELDRLAASNPAIDQIVTIKVRPFNRQQTRALLGQRLQAVGIDRIDDSAVVEIQRSSGGLPAQILRAAEQFPPGAAGRAATGYRYVPVFIALFVGLVAAITALRHFQTRSVLPAIDAGLYTDWPFGRRTRRPPGVCEAGSRFARDT